MPKIAGRATTDGTARYAARFAGALGPGHFRTTDSGLTLSSIGLGSYMGRADAATDEAYAGAAGQALRSGVNVLDTAINYRHMRSERALGHALARAIASGEVLRDEVVVATKGGFLAFDGELPADPRGWFARNYLATGILDRDDVVAQCHAVSPRFLEHQLLRSLDNLGLETVDIYYLHNPEMQLAELGPEEFRRRLRLAFGFLENQVALGRIGAYGLATWRGLVSGRDRPDHLPLGEIVELAGEVAGPAHHLRVVQLPVNAEMLEAIAVRNQGTEDHPQPLVEAAREVKLAVVSSATLRQGRLVGEAPDWLDAALPELPSPALRAIQFTRSAPGVTVALVGMKTPEHVRENVELCRVGPLAAEEFRRRFGSLEGRLAPDPRRRTGDA
jgi:aryl-alcohol dehydrogenase-like predicted oxidoreductase